MNKLKVVRVTTTEYELEDGTVNLHVVPFTDEDVPTLEEFQEQLDTWHQKFLDMGICSDD